MQVAVSAKIQPTVPNGWSGSAGLAQVRFAKQFEVGAGVDHSYDTFRVHVVEIAVCADWGPKVLRSAHPLLPENVAVSFEARDDAGIVPEEELVLKNQKSMGLRQLEIRLKNI